MQLGCKVVTQVQITNSARAAKIASVSTLCDAFSRIKSCTRPTGSLNFVVFENFTRAYLHQIAPEIMLLPILITDV